jgi:hypothetical protein
MWVVALGLCCGLGAFDHEGCRQYADSSESFWNVLLMQMVALHAVLS